MLANKFSLQYKLVFLLLITSFLGNAQAKLPVSRSTWNETPPVGWSDWGAVATTPIEECFQNAGKLENTGDYYEIFFDTIPNQLSFQIKADSFSNGNFSLQESPDGVYWSNIKVYKSISNNCERQKSTLKSTSRYIRFYYSTKGKGNIYIDEVEITSAN